MDKEIEVGEYVRTYNKGIKRIDTIFKNRPVNRYGYEIGSEWDGKLYSIIKTTDIVKHSKNIIDLIEVGDYVNGRLVLQVDYKNKNVCLLIQLTDTKANTNIMWYGFEDIKSILTKEQFNANCYEVKE